MSQHIKTRLSQIDWEITHPKEFLTQIQIDIILNKLHTWRRLVPLYREMITETSLRVFRSHEKWQLPSPPSCSTPPGPLDPFRDEFYLVLGQMEEYERRIDRLTTVVTSAISIVDSRRVERLTFLAMLFAPLSLVGTLFSMSDDITGIRNTFGWWAAASAACVAVMFGWTAWSRKQSLKAKLAGEVRKWITSRGTRMLDLSRTGGAETTKERRSSKGCKNDGPARNRTGVSVEEGRNS